MISNRTYIDISGDALRANLVALRGALPESTRTMSVIKSNAYGHGLLQAAWALQSHTDWFAVDDIEEAKILRQHGVRNPILVLGAVPEEWYSVARSLHVTVTSTSLIALRWAVNHGVDTHIKLDTGLGRQGFRIGPDFTKALEYLKRHTPRYLTGVYTHYAVADDPSQVEYTRQQYELFQNMAVDIDAVMGRHITTHASGTSGVMYGGQFTGDMARLGIGLYGLWPARTMADRVPGIQLLPAMTWRARISEVKHIEKGATIGYDRTYCVTARDSRVAIIPVGYWHGIPRSASNQGFVMVNQTRVPIVGNVSMDMISVNVSAVVGPVAVGDWVDLAGISTPIHENADLAGISHYEYVTRINPLIERRLR